MPNALNMLTQPLIDPHKRSLSFQIGNWGAENWATLASYILNRHPGYQIILLGKAKEGGLAEDFYLHLKRRSKKADQVINQVGKTDFSSWASIIGKSQWLISGHCTALHLASLLGTPVMELAVQTRKWAEDGPYGNGHVVIAPSSKCQDLVSPEAVYATWAYTAQEWIFRKHLDLSQYFDQLHWKSEREGLSVYRSHIRSSEKGGGLYFESLLPKPLLIEEWSAQFLGYLARTWYCGWVPPLDQELSRNVLSPSLIQEIRQLSMILPIFNKILNDAICTAERLANICSGLCSKTLIEISQREEIVKLGEALQKFDQEIEAIGASHLTLRAFGRISKVLLQNLVGENIFELSQESVESYRQLRQGVILLQEWVQHTLALTKPIAIAQDEKVILLHPDARL
jgi:hypothetical protein